MSVEAVIENEAAEDIDLGVDAEIGAEEETQPESIDEGGEELSIDQLLEKENSDKELSEEELDRLDDHHNGDAKPKKDEPEAKEEKPKDDKKPEEKAEKEEEDEPEEDQSALDLKIQKEVGAKDKSEVAAKIKGLRQAVSGKLEKAPEFQQMKADNQTLMGKINSEVQLMQDAQKGNPKAIEHILTHYNLKVVPEGTTITPTETEDPTVENKTILDREAFVDDEAYEATNSALTKQQDTLDKQQAQIDELLAEVKASKDEVQHNRNETSKAQAEVSMIDEIVEVSAKLPGLSKMKDIRPAIKKWLDDRDAGKPTDKRFNVFNDYFLMANKKKISLVDAYLMDEGSKSDLKYANAKLEGKKEAYRRTPNSSLSGLQGSRGEGENRQFTDAQVTAMESDDKLMPEEWFDSEENPVKAKVPPEARHLFWAD